MLPLAQSAPLTGSPLGNLFLAIVALAVIVLIGRLLLSVAWKILVVAGIAVAVLYGLSLLPL